MSTTTLQVRKDQLDQTRLVTTEDTALADGQVRLRVEHFALTANNITYAAFGEGMQYWQFFPSGDAPWGIVPVWGFASVVQSLHPGVAVGERLYGYWPMAGSAVLQPRALSETGFGDGAPHRKGLHPVYNHYLRCHSDPFHAYGSEGMQALLRPLFVTSWLIDDFLADNAFFGADTMVLSSASSKTAYGTAFQLKQRSGISVIGLTSARNRAYCESLGCYTQVLSYEELERLPQDSACVYIDFAGNAALRLAVHQRFRNLKYSCSVGGTHVKSLGGARDLPGPKATLFFAPAQIKKRHDDWGAAELENRLVAAWRDFSSAVSAGDPPWLVVQEHRGPQAVQAAYAQVFAGNGDPRIGHILSLATL
jgi:hypothetical protein